MQLTWHDPQAIAETLYDQDPELDPTTLSFVALHEMVCQLEEFSDDPEASNEKVLEAILMAWLAERD